MLSNFKVHPNLSHGHIVRFPENLLINRRTTMKILSRYKVRLKSPLIDKYTLLECDQRSIIFQHGVPPSSYTSFIGTTVWIPLMKKLSSCWPKISDIILVIQSSGVFFPVGEWAIFRRSQIRRIDRVIN